MLYTGFCNITLANLFHYLDNIFFTGPVDTRDCFQALADMLTLCQAVQAPLKPEKVLGPATLLSILGIELDTKMRARLPPDKLTALMEEFTRDNSVEFFPLERGWSGPGLADPSTILVAIEAKCARGIHEELKIRGTGVQLGKKVISFQDYVGDVDVVTEAIDRVSSILCSHSSLASL